MFQTFVHLRLQQAPICMDMQQECSKSGLRNTRYILTYRKDIVDPRDTQYEKSKHAWKVGDRHGDDTGESEIESEIPMNFGDG
jgi:hypothetical protein